MTGSSKNSEPNRLVVVRERARLATLAALGPFGRFIGYSAATIVIAQTQKHEFDAGRCAQNMMVAAWAEGVGSCPAHLPEPEVARILGIPNTLFVNRVIAFGYVDPARAAAPALVRHSRKPLTELVHWETW
jgi:nitroreductase